LNFTRVTASCKDIKAMAKQTIEGRWLKLALPMILVTLLMNLPVMLFSMDDSGSFLSYLTYGLGIVLLGLVFFASGAYSLSIFRMEERPAARLMTPVQKKQFFLRAVGLFSLIALLVLIGLVLFVVPGIMALYKYSQAFFILFDHPEYTPTQCLMASAAMMRGNKGQRFKLDLSFLAWYLLPLVPVVIVAAPMAQEGFRASMAFVQSLSAEELQPIMTDESAYMTFMEQLGRVESEALQAYLNAHPMMNTLQIVADILELLLTSVAAVFTGCASACFYELASGKLSLKMENELHSAAEYNIEV